MAQKNFMSWLGFRGDADDEARPNEALAARIHELEAEIADLRARRDITALTREDFEILATETAVSMIRSAQQREQSALAQAQRLIEDAKRSAKNALEQAERRAQALLNSAESSAQKIIVQAEVKEIEKITEADNVVKAKNIEAHGIIAAAQREAESIVAESKNRVKMYREWLNGAIAEADRRQKSQHSALLAVEQSMAQVRHKVDGTFDLLRQLGLRIEESIDEDGEPITGAFEGDSQHNGSARKPAQKKPKKPLQKKVVKKTTVTKSSQSASTTGARAKKRK